MYKSKNNKRKLSLRGLLSITLLLLVVVVILLTTTMNSSNAMRIVPIDAIAADNFAYTDGGFIYIENSQIHFVKIRSKRSDWVTAISPGNTKISASKTLCAVYGDAGFEVFNNKGQPLSISNEFAGTVQDIKCGKNTIAVLNKSANDVYTIFLFSSEGVNLDVIEFSDQLLDFNFYSDSDYLWTLTLNTAGSTPVSTVTTYTTGQATTGRMSIEDQLVENIFFDGRNLYICGTDYLIGYDQTAKQLFRTQTYGHKVVDFLLYESKTYFLLMPRTDPDNGLETSSAKLLEPVGEREVELRVPKNNIGAFFSSTKVNFISADRLVSYSLSGKSSEELHFESTFDNISKLDAVYGLLQNSQGYSTLKLK